ncbi:mannose-1-phosphate guanylyltransferase/mannose-6-phosphate isomerase [Campylobacter volucris]|uniref:mannose-1-phosphate guanylyltransferase/mannose-6-phosphate isomerase n=1 Tax=Campylobacter volucris TaxID=1031542 RepID=UPI001059CBB4|nr:mannose-1-phosphate guanylyltransferase/mannose-6-phosphate isomerase [Campylobacter volucris]TDJ82090.1 mannose-1-phosphate guanylyltransferase/mannose-6-phosphate isomerase [Campylobacter volucris]
MTNIILCGGSGTRLWPLSRSEMPKQFLKIFNNYSLFELTLKRNFNICDNTLIVSNENQYFLALDQLNDVKVNSNFILEPISKNTAPAIILACLSLPLDEIVLVTPSDHLIKDEIVYKDVIYKAIEFAKEDNLVTFGIKPSKPEVGYGYIKIKNNYEVDSFIEKPDIEKALDFFQDKSYFWNSGIFLFKVGFFLEQIKKYAFNVYDFSLKAYENSIKQDNFIKIRQNDMEKIPNISIDYALMEKTKDIKIIPSDIKWNDLGSFESLSTEFAFNNENNYSNTDSKFIESKNNFIYSQDNTKFIAGININDLIIIDTQDALLISDKSSSQKVKQIYEFIKDNKKLSKNHLTAYRPWGSFTILENNFGYKIKHIEVKPGKRLSLQKHFHRNEHWVILSGTATVEIDGKENIVRPNESIYIKMGQIHRLSNNGKIPVILIEAQVGEYTEEDDIIRLEDDYKRN